MEPDIVASPTGGFQGPIEVVTPTSIRKDTRGFLSAPTTPSLSFADIKKQLECTKAEHRTAPPTPFASETPWKSDLGTTITASELFSSIKRRYEEKRATGAGPTQDGSPPQRYKETSVPPSQPRFNNLTWYETYTPRVRADADLTCDETPSPKRARTEGSAWKPTTRNTIPSDLIALNPIRSPVPAPVPDDSPPQRHKETPIPPRQPKLYNSASHETSQPKRPRIALPSWRPRPENTIPYNSLVSNTLQPASHVPPPAPSPKRRPGRPRKIVIPKEKSPPPSAPTNLFTPKSMRIHALERDLRLSRDEAEVWRKGNEGAMEMWRAEHLEAEILRRKFEGLGGERAWQQVVWSGSAAAAGVLGASKEMAFVVD